MRPITFVEGPIDGVIFRPLTPHADSRGWLVELFRADEVAREYRPVMAYLSETVSGAARGPHEHAQQADYFAFVGPGEFTLYLWDARPESPTFGHRMKVVVGEASMQSVLVPPGVVHGYKNTGNVPGWVLNAPNHLYAGRGKREPIDEIRHEDRPDNPYRMD